MKSTMQYVFMGYLIFYTPSHTEREDLDCFFFPLKDILVKAPQMSWHNISMRSMPETGHQKNKFFD